jgi:hypothetical protein
LIRNEYKNVIDHLNWRGGYGFLFCSEFFFRTTQEIEYLIFLSRGARNFFPEFNIRLYDKNSESDYFFYLHQNQNIFFSKGRLCTCLNQTIKFTVEHKKGCKCLNEMSSINEMVRERPFNLKGGLWFFLKKYSDSQCCWKKYSDFGGDKKNNLIQSFCHTT